MRRGKGGNVSCVTVIDINTNFLLLVIGLVSQLGIPTYMNPKFEFGSLTCLYFKILILWHVLTPSFRYDVLTIRCDFETILRRFTAISDYLQRLTAIFIQFCNDSLRFQTIFWRFAAISDSLQRQFSTTYCDFDTVLRRFTAISDGSQRLTAIWIQFGNDSLRFQTVFNDSMRFQTIF